MKQVAADFVILNEQAQAYAQELQPSREAQVRTRQSRLQHEAH